MVILCQAWTETFPIYGILFQEMVSRSDNPLPISSGVILVSYFICLVIFSFTVSMQNIKKLLVAGVISSAVIGMLMWFFPVMQAFFILYTLMGLSTALISISVCYIVVYGIPHEYRMKATALYLFGWYLLVYLLSRLLLLLPPAVVFILSNLLLLSVIYLSHRFDVSEMVLPSSIAKKSYPYKLLALLAVIIFILYGNDTLIRDAVGVNPEYLLPKWVVPLLGLAVYLVFYFLHTKVNYFILLYGSLILLSSAYLLHMLNNTMNVKAIIQVAGSFLNVFIFSFVGFISLKYGRTFTVFRMILFSVAMGSIFGNSFGGVMVSVIKNNTQFSLVIPLFIIFISFLVMPWLAKFMNDEVKTEKPGNEVIAPVQDAQPVPVMPLHVVKHKVVYANTCLPTGNKLTPREMEIAELLLERYDNETICKRLNISPNTSKVHIGRIYHKFQVSKKRDFISLVEKFWDESGRDRDDCLK
jgi:DNA-binding CsgD family transcriptional regulator/MFS family permease